MNNKNISDDSKIINGCLKRDLVAWTRFIGRYSCLITRSIDCRLKKYGFSLPSHDIEDLCQDVLASIWQERKLESLANIATFRYWLAIVSGNHAVEHMRKNRIARFTALPADDILEASALNGILPSSLSPADELARQELRRKVDDALRELPGPEKVAIQLSIIHGKTLEDIAAITGSTAGAVASSVSRAKERLRVALKDYL